MGNEAPQQKKGSVPVYNKNIDKTKLEILLKKIFYTTQLQNNRKKGAVAQKERELLSLIAKPKLQRSKDNESAKASAIVSDTKFVKAQECVMRYSDIVKDRVLVIQMSKGDPSKINDLLPFIESIVWGCNNLNLDCVRDLEMFLHDAFGPEVFGLLSKGQHVLPELRECFASVLPTDRDVKIFLLEFCKKNSIEIDLMNEVGHNISESALADLPTTSPIDSSGGSNMTGGSGPSNGGYPGSNGGYPGSDGGYPGPNQGGYPGPGNQGGYPGPGNQGGYPGPGNQGGYPGPNQGGFPGSNGGGYPGGGYPGGNGGHGGQVQTQWDPNNKNLVININANPYANPSLSDQTHNNPYANQFYPQNPTQNQNQPQNPYQQQPYQQQQYQPQNYSGSSPYSNPTQIPQQGGYQPPIIHPQHSQTSNNSQPTLSQPSQPSFQPTQQQQPSYQPPTYQAPTQNQQPLPTTSLTGGLALEGSDGGYPVFKKMEFTNIPQQGGNNDLDDFQARLKNIKDGL